MDKELMSLFWSLAEGEDDHRTNAVGKLIDILRGKQNMTGTQSKELEYTLKRLIKGLASNRKWARLGYAVALTQVLRTFPFIRVQDVNMIVKEELKILKDNSKKEQSSLVLGRVMASLCLVQADKLLQVKPTSVALYLQADGSEVRHITEMFKKVKKEKPPLHQICTQGLIQVMSKVSEETFTNHVWPVLEEDCRCGWKDCHPDNLLLILTVKKYHKNTLSKAFLSKHWECKKLISESTMDKLGTVLAKSTSDHPILHPVCEMLLSEVAQKPSTFTHFWTTVIDGFLLNQPLPKKYLCLQLVPKALTFVTLAEQVKAILTPNLMGLLLKQMPNKQQPLNSAVKELLNRLIQQISTFDQDDLQLAMVTSILQSPSHVQFDHMTKTNTLVDLIRQMRGGATEIFARMLMDTILGENKLVDDSTAERDVVTKWAAQMLASLVTQVSKATDSDWQVGVLEFLFMRGFVQVKKTTNAIPHGSKTVSLSSQLTEVLQENFFRALNKLSTFSPGKGGKSRKHYTEVLRKFITFIQQVLSDGKHFMLHKELSKESKAHLDKIFTLVRKIQVKSESSEKMGTEEAFELLFIHMGLKLFTDPQEVSDALEDLYVCYEKAFQKEKKRPSNEHVDEEEEPEWVEVVTDLLLSLLAQKSHLVRSVVKTVFTLLCGNLTSPALGLILDVLKSTGSEEESAIDFEEDEEEDMMDVTGSEEQEVEGKDQADLEVESESESSEDDEEEEDTGPAEYDVEEALKKNVKSALGKAALESNDELSDDDLSDSEMEKLDGALAAAFKSMKRTKTDEKLKRVQLKHYKMRCLDLLEVLVQNETSTCFLLEILEPLLEVMEQTQKEKDMKELYQRASAVYHALVASRKLTSPEECDKSSLIDTIQELVTLSTKVTGIPMVLEVGKAVLFVIRVMLGMDNNVAPAALCPFIKKPLFEATESRPQDLQHLEKIYGVLRKSVQDFCQKRESLLNHMLFHEILEKQTVLMWPLMPDLLRLARNSDVRVFCRTHICSMMATMISKNTVATLGEECWRESAADITTQLTQILNAALEEKHRKPKFLHDVLLVLHKVFQFSSDELLEQILPDAFLENMESAKDKLKTRDLKGICNKLSQLIRRRLHIEQNQSKRKEKKKRKQELREMEQETTKKIKLSDSPDSSQDTGDSEDSETEATLSQDTRASSSDEHNLTVSQNGNHVAAGDKTQQTSSKKSKKRRRTDV